MWAADSPLPLRALTEVPASSRRPEGIIAVLLAIGIAGGAAWGVEIYARRLATRHLRVVSALVVPFKYQTLTIQRAAFASGHVLPIYGSSELFCCGSPYRPTQAFASEPTGFGALAVGSAGTGDLFFTETFAALGHALNGKKLVVSDSPQWFFSRRGLSRAEYAATFLPEVAYALAFDASVSLDLREAVARRMLAYPQTLEDQPLLRVAVEDLADPTPMHLAEYLALAPLGRVAMGVLRFRDAARTVAFIWERRRLLAHLPSRPRAFGWVPLARRGTNIAERRDTTNPFGFPNSTYRRLRHTAQFQRALTLYESGRTNRDGRLLPPPTVWEAAMPTSAEWTDLELELRVLRELGARPLIWTLPMPGVFDDYTSLSAVAREKYYDRYQRVAEEEKVPWLDFRAYDEDRYFLTDRGSHLSPRGWVFADRALDMFWHGQPIDEIRGALATLALEVPSPSVPAHGADAMGSR